MITAGRREFNTLSDTERSTMRIIILLLVMLQLTGTFESCTITVHLRKEWYSFILQESNSVSVKRRRMGKKTTGAEPSLRS
jgi:hypothetical protein